MQPDDFKVTTKKYSRPFRLEAILGSMETQPWEVMPENWTQMLTGKRYYDTVDDDELSWYGHRETLEEVTAKILQAAECRGSP